MHDERKTQVRVCGVMASAASLLIVNLASLVCMSDAYTFYRTRETSTATAAMTVTATAAAAATAVDRSQIT